MATARCFFGIHLALIPVIHVSFEAEAFPTRAAWLGPVSPESECNSVEQLDFVILEVISGAE